MDRAAHGGFATPGARCAFAVAHNSLVHELIDQESDSSQSDYGRLGKWTDPKTGETMILNAFILVLSFRGTCSSPWCGAWTPRRGWTATCGRSPFLALFPVGLFSTILKAGSCTRTCTIRCSTAATPNCVADICRRLDGVPLAIELAAIELAAARVPSLGLSQISACLTERLRMLSRGGRLDSPRHRTLGAAIDWSYALLDNDERRLLERLSVFAGGGIPEAVAPVCGWDLADSDDLIDVLVGLVDKSLVMTDQRGGSIRYRLLETIREYASERLEASGEAPVVRRRHVAYFRSLADRRGVTRRGVWYASDMELVRREHDNLRAAVGTLLSLGDFGGVSTRSRHRGASMAGALAGKVAVITGAGRGIGRAFALALAGEGCRVAAADVDLEGAEATVSQIEASGGTGAALHVDVTQRASVARLMLSVVDRWTVHQARQLRSTLLMAMGASSLSANHRADLLRRGRR